MTRSTIIFAAMTTIACVSEEDSQRIDADTESASAERAPAAAETATTDQGDIQMNAKVAAVFEGWRPKGAAEGGQPGRFEDLDVSSGEPNQQEPDDQSSPESESPVQPHDPSAFVCVQAPDVWQDCPIFDEGALDNVKGLAELNEACVRWQNLRPEDYDAYAVTVVDGAELDEKSAKATVCGAWVSDARNLETGERIDDGDFSTVEMIFAEIGAMMMFADGPVNVEYDNDFGYPFFANAGMMTDAGPAMVTVTYDLHPLRSFEPKPDETD